MAYALVPGGVFAALPRLLLNTTLGTQKAWPVVAQQHLLQKVLHLRHVPLTFLPLGGTISTTP